MDKLLEDVKKELGIMTNDTFINTSILLKIKAVKGYLVNAGAKIDENNVPEEITSCIAVGVNDLLNNKAGETKFSPAFKMLAMQICR